MQYGYKEDIILNLSASHPICSQTYWSVFFIPISLFLSFFLFTFYSIFLLGKAQHGESLGAWLGGLAKSLKNLALLTIKR